MTTYVGEIRDTSQKVDDHEDVCVLVGLLGSLELSFESMGGRGIETRQMITCE